MDKSHPCHSPEATLKRAESLRRAWKHRKDYIGEKKFSNLYNCWRAFKYTTKGIKIGSSQSWEKYENFYNDMVGSYQDGLRLIRIDKTKNFCKENCMWMTEFEASQIAGNIVYIEFNGMKKSLKEWAIYANVPYTGLRQRYYKSKNYTIEEIIYGIKKRKRKPITDITKLSGQARLSKVSKMIAQYKCRDKKKGFSSDVTRKWMMENVMNKNCTYCGSDQNIGCDRIDNKVGHLMSNIVPCCRDCNAIRGDLFTVDEMKILGETIKLIYANR